MIYFDNGATSLQKPPEVARAVAGAVNTLGNAGRSAYPAAMQAARTIYAVRAGVGGLAGLQNPLQVAFTSGFTEGLNLIVGSMVTKADHVITTELEHNSVLRPLYLSGCGLDFIPAGEDGQLQLETLPKLLKKNTKYLFCTHGSNLLGTLPDVQELKRFCKRHGLIMVMDVAQTFGHIPVDACMADLLCFTGHKALFGPQGTGGIIMQKPLPLRICKTGGTGTGTFAPLQPATMPDAFEAGTANGPGLAGLLAGVQFIKETGVERIAQKEAALAQRFLQGIHKIPNVTLYGLSALQPRLPIVALNIKGRDSADIALRLWEEYGIATRPGSHCAPLLHQRFGTEKQGMVRFSFGYFNTQEEIDAGVKAVAAIAAGAP